MLDIKFIRENIDLVRNAAQKKHISIDINHLVRLDDERLRILSEVQNCRTAQNTVSDQIPTVSDPAERELLITRMREVKETAKILEESLATITKEWQELMWQVPNIPDLTVPDGDSDADNLPIKFWGDRPDFNFQPQHHVDLMTKLGMVDFERGTKVHGFRGYFLQDAGALLSFAIWNYARDFFMARGFDHFMIPPIVANRENFYGTGHLPNDADDLYTTQDGQNLAGTAEVPIMGYYADEVLDVTEFPKRVLAFSPCYRREAGSHGKDTRGLIRVHEFYKFEQVILCEASHQESVRWHEWVNSNTEAFIESLGIPYRTVVNCGGDIGQGQVKKYDIELWVPLENKYREISSASYFHDFQTRRFNIRYRDKDGKMRFAHSLNSTAIPTPRILVSLIENYQQSDGSIKIPEPLVPYFGRSEIR